jgi:acetyltransferase-like isoleucine patch superfamily enzyme
MTGPASSLPAAAVRRMVDASARRLKGEAYHIDPEVPLLPVLGMSGRRATALARGAIRGLVRPGRPPRCVFLGRDVELRNRRLIHFGTAVTVGRGSVIDGLSRRGVTIGDAVAIGAYTMIEGTGVVTELGEGCSIGRGSAIGPFSFVGAAGGVVVGENVLMGNRVSFHSENHRFDDPGRPIREQGVSRRGIRIDDDCWVGANVTFLDGATVGKGCVIGAGSVVRGEIPAYAVAAGVPARVVRSRRAR